MGNCCVKEEEENEHNKQQKDAKKPKPKKSKNPALHAGASRYKTSDAPAETNDAENDNEENISEKSFRSPSGGKEPPAASRNQKARPLPKVVSLDRSPPAAASREGSIPRPGSAAVQPNGEAATRAPSTPAAAAAAVENPSSITPLSPATKSDATLTQPSSVIATHKQQGKGGVSPVSPTTKELQPVTATASDATKQQQQQPPPTSQRPITPTANVGSAAVGASPQAPPKPTSALAEKVAAVAAAATEDGTSAADGTASRTVDADGRPKMVEFELNFDNDDDLLHIEEMSEEAVEEFGIEDAATPPRPAKAASAQPQQQPSSTSSSLPQQASSKAVTAPPTPKLDKNWFLDRGVYPPKEVLWSQSKSTVSVKISPADASSGWEYDPKRSILEFNGVGPKGTIAVALPLLQRLYRPDFFLDTVKGCLVFTGHKAGKGEEARTSDTNEDDDDDDEEPSTYWVQLLRGSRKEYAALPFIRREIVDDDDEDDEDEGADEQAEKKKSVYKFDYSKPSAAAAEDVEAFSDPDD